MDWIQLSSTLGNTVILCAMLGWLTRSIIIHWLSKDVEAHKLKLQKDIEVYKLKLQTAANEYQLRFSNIQEKQIEAITQLHQALQQATIGFQRLKLLEEQENTAVAKRVTTASFNAMALFRLNELYFEDDLRLKIAELLAAICTYSSNYHDMKKSVQDTGNFEEWQKLEPKIQHLLRDLRKEFQRLLGVTKPSSLNQ